MAVPALEVVSRIKHGKPESGFTLIEILTAFLVLSVATTVFIGLYTGSLSLAKSSQNHRVAALIAEESLSELQNSPDAYVWPNFDGSPIGEFKPVTPLEDTGAVLAADLPSAMPNNERSHNRVRNLYQNFSWQTFARLPEKDANYVEVFVVVHWQHHGRPQQFYLTSAVPRSIGEGIG